MFSSLKAIRRSAHLLQRPQCRSARGAMQEKVRSSANSRPISTTSYLARPANGVSTASGQPSALPARDYPVCRRAHGRQGRCAPLARWPEDGPSLTAAARDDTGCAQVGMEGWCRSNKRMEH